MSRNGFFRRFLKLGLCGLLPLAAAFAASAQAGLVCGDPTDKGCAPQYEGFGPHDLTFLTGRAELGAGTTHESDEFYAVILESVPAASSKSRNGCDFVSESKRLAAQKQFPRNKAFASRNACTGNVVLYDGTDADFNFMAVYGGKTAGEADKVLARARRRYPQANVRRMRVRLDFADE
jgi:hypothetical protein